jgi:predicted PurR-regulated permease PerM
MKETSNTSDNLNREKQSIDLTIKLLLIVFLLAWCIMIILPFLIPILWGSIMAITLYPLYTRLLKLLKGRKGLASSIITAILLIILIVPFVWLISSVVGSAGEFLTALRENTLVIPPPNPKVANWYLIGEPLYNGWKNLNTNLEATILKFSPQLINIGDKFLGVAKSVASNFILLLLSMVISGIFLANTEKSQKSAVSFANRLAGKGGDEFIQMIVLTIRNVAKGILGVAFIQFVLMGAVLIAAKVPLAGLWALLVLLFAIVQLPVGIVALPVIIYLYSAREPLPATLWSVLLLLFGLLDNVLKPWLMGKGAPVPMLVIFLGAIGGMIMSGFIGLFTGAIVLSIGYKLVTAWLQGNKPEKGSLPD